MSKDKIISLAVHAGDSRLWTVEQMLEDAIQEAAERKPTKGIVLMLSDLDDGYEYAYLQSGMKASQIVSLLEVAKQNFIRDILDAD